MIKTIPIIVSNIYAYTQYIKINQPVLIWV